MKPRKKILKHSNAAIAEAVVYPITLTAVQKKEAAAQLAAARKAGQAKMTESERLSLQLFQLRFRLESYFEKNDFNPELTFGYFLKQYVELLRVKRKDFAEMISIDETMLSQFINLHRDPPEYMAIRLEIHSNNAIPAIYWFRLVEKKKEHELKTNAALRKKEIKNVHSKLEVSLT